MSETYIIHTRPYNEKKQFLVLFTEEMGTTSLAVSSKAAYHPFTLYKLDSTPKRRSKRLQSTNSLPLFLMGKKLYCGLYINELIYLFCKENDSHPSLFHQYRNTLQLLSQSKEIEPILRQFELALIEAAGYALHPEHFNTPHVSFSMHNGLSGHNTATEYSIPREELEKMRYAQSSSTTGKKFIRHILNTILTRKSKSRFFYEKVQTNNSLLPQV